MHGWISRMQRALALLAARLDEPPTLEELAAAAAISPFHFHRAWRSMTGETVGQTVARLRIAIAQQRLTESRMSVTAAAMEGGFGTPQSFARTFRRVTGVSPTEFLSGGAANAEARPRDDVPVRIELRAVGELVVLRRDGGAYRELNALFGRLWSWAEEAGKLGGLQGIYGIPLDDPSSVAEDRLRYDACLAIADPGSPPPPLKLRPLPAGRYAALRHTGSYDGLEAANQQLLGWLLASGQEPADAPLIHHFLDDPDETATEDLRTDILIRLQPEARP